MNGERAKRKLTAILSADVKGYSRLMGDDELATIEALKKHKELISSLVDQFQGRVVDSPGDNLLAEFGSAVDAVECAVKIQEELKKENELFPESRRMEFRIGVNLGDVVEDGERIYGDGVNIAARIESLADGGGICISRTAYDQVKNKISVGYEYLGEHSVKNIKDPVRVYRLLPDAMAKGSVVYKRRRDDPRHRRRAAFIALVIVVVAVAALLVWNFCLRDPKIAPASVERMAFPIPEKPSIAILSFTNMSGDPKHDYIGDGLSENIISALSISSKILVIARNTTFAYKGKPVNIKQVAEDLGVQYVLEGSIQKSGDRLRVTAQLIDALSGHHLWSEKYDRAMKELFDLQDEITKNIVLSLRVELIEGEDYRVYSKSTENLEALNYWIKGHELYEKLNNKDNAKAKECFEAALKLDPGYVGARTSLAAAHLTDAMMGWSDDPSVSRKRALELIQQALEIDDQSPVVHMLLGNQYRAQGQREKAITEYKLAIKLNPNYAQAHGFLARTMMFSGKFDEAIDLTKKAFRLDPKLAPVFLNTLCESFIFLKRYEEALEVISQMEEHAQKGDFIMNFIPPLMYSFVYHELGREEEARGYMAEALKCNPNFSLVAVRRSNPYINPSHLQRMIDAYRKAGMPEKEPGAVR